MKFKTFNNPRIFADENDFTVGGFITDQNQLDWGRLKVMMEHRIYQAVTQWIENEMAQPSENPNIKEETKRRNVIIGLALYLETMIDLKIQEYTIDAIVEQILSSDRYVNWREKIRIRYTEYTRENKQSLMGIPTNVLEQDEEAILFAENETENINLDNILEILAGIYENR